MAYASVLNQIFFLGELKTQINETSEKTSVSACWLNHTQQTLQPVNPALRMWLLFSGKFLRVTALKRKTTKKNNRLIEETGLVL